MSEKCEACGQDHELVECAGMALHDGIRAWLDAGLTVPALLEELAAHLRDYLDEDVIPENLTKN